MSETRMVGVAGTLGQVQIPWSLHLEAWENYKKQWGGYQTAERLAERGGFHADELDKYVPDWRERTSEIASLRQQVEQLSASNARMAEALKNLYRVCQLALEGEEDGLQYSYFETRQGSFISAVGVMDGAEKALSTYDPAWLEADRAEAGRKAQVSLLRSMIADLDDSSYGADDLQKIIDRIELKQKPHNPNDCQCGGGDCSSCPR